MVDQPELAEREAIRCLLGVGAGTEWWLWNQSMRVGHLRVAVTPDENATLPCGVAAHDAGACGPRRPRTMK